MEQGWGEGAWPPGAAAPQLGSDRSKVGQGAVPPTVRVLRSQTPELPSLLSPGKACAPSGAVTWSAGHSDRHTHIHIQGHYKTIPTSGHGAWQVWGHASSASRRPSRGL